MGSQPPLEEITVLVTGFGPFRDQYPVNPSYEIARDLPSYLPPLRPKDPSIRGHRSSSIPEVRIIVHPEPIRVNYQRVRSLVPTFWDGAVQGRKIDMCVHIGMAGPRPFYQIERRGHRRGYNSKDVDGELLADEEEDEKWTWRGCPDEIESDLSIRDVMLRWKGYSPRDMDLRISDDAGHYLCDFIYYSSLAHLWKQGRDRKLTFFHVPADPSKEAISLGRELCINLIRAMVESEVAKRERPGNEDGGVEL